MLYFKIDGVCRERSQEAFEEAPTSLIRETDRERWSVQLREEERDAQVDHQQDAVVVVELLLTAPSPIRFRIGVNIKKNVQD